MRWQVEAAVPPQQAFDYVADFTRHPEWAMDDMTVQPRTAGPLRVGSRFDAAGILFGRRNPSTLTVTELDPPARLGFDAEDRRGVTHHEFRFTAQEGGTVIERELTRVKQPWFGPVLSFLLRGAVDKGFGGSLQKLKVMLEAVPRS